MESTGQARGALVLCGGASRRMGRDKATLPLGDFDLLTHTLTALQGQVAEVIVVAAAEQRLPGLPNEVRVVRDTQPYGGPLAAIPAGLRGFTTQVTAAFITSCDSPFLREAVVRRLFEVLRQHSECECVMPCDGEQLYPLTAVYRTHLADKMEQLLHLGERRIRVLANHVPTWRVPLAELRDIDPELQSFWNLNRPEEYAAAIERWEGERKSRNQLM